MTRRILERCPLSVVRCPLTSDKQRTMDHGPRTDSAGFTLIEMLIAMAITLVMIGAVVTLFANLSNSVRDRRAVVEMSGQLRHARNMLQQDLQGATCNGLVWQRPDENQGYIEIIEGQQSDRNPSSMLRDTSLPPDGVVDAADFDVAVSILPRNNAVVDLNNNGRIENNETDQYYTRNPQSLALGGIGDFDDTLMLTVRNEHEPFVGRQPANVRINATDAAGFDVNPNTNAWSAKTLESPLAEVVWYAVENPEEAGNVNGFFGEPGMRTIYRRTLLIAPWINPYRFVQSNGNFDDTFQIPGDSAMFTAQPGLVRILPKDISVAKAIAGLIAFQERYDLSVRLEFDPLMDPSNGGRWKIVANTLGDLTKRENRYGHIGYGYDDFVTPARFSRLYPFPMVSLGVGHGNVNVAVAYDPELTAPTPAATIRASLSNGNVVSYQVDPGITGYKVPPFLYFSEDVRNQATARAMLDDEGEIVRVIHGPVPLSGERRGEDVMLTDALAFDLRVYDPGAPLYKDSGTETVVDPCDPGWRYGYDADVANMNDTMGDSTSFVGQGAYVDLGYGFQRLIPRSFVASGSAVTAPWFFASPLEIENTQVRYLTDPTPPGYVQNRGVLSDAYLRYRDRPADSTSGSAWQSQLAPGYAVYDTWSFHYENNGLNEDARRVGSSPPDVDALIDEGTNGLDDPGSYVDGFNITRLGPDDVGERETVPPYDKPLRGVQVLLRLYERDSRQIRQVSVNQSFVPE